MITKYVRYKVQPDKVEDVRAAIAAFVAGIRQHEPGTLVYEAFQEDDPTRFLHLMVFLDEAAEQFHRATAHVQSFVDTLYPNCEEQPVFVDVAAVDGVRRSV